MSILSNAIQKMGTSPLTYWSDNGKENISDLMRLFLSNHLIFPITTEPGTPEENGKIEKWWPKCDEWLEGIDNWEDAKNVIDMYVNTYNTKIPHLGLEKLNGFNAYPSEVYCNIALQKTTIYECTIKIDNKGEIPLDEFLRKIYDKLKDKHLFTHCF